MAYASKMGGTAGIAEVIADELRSCGISVDLRQANSVRIIEGYDGVVLGSAVYAGRWRKPAVALLRTLAEAAERGEPRPVWLFHSGPTGSDAPTTMVSAPAKVARLAAAIGAEPPETFGGRLVPETAKGFLARKLAEGEKGGDYRDFDHARAWAKGIARSVGSASRRP